MIKIILLNHIEPELILVFKIYFLTILAFILSLIWIYTNFILFKITTIKFNGVLHVYLEFRYLINNKSDEKISAHYGLYIIILKIFKIINFILKKISYFNEIKFYVDYRFISKEKKTIYKEIFSFILKIFEIILFIFILFILLWKFILWKFRNNRVDTVGFNVAFIYLSVVLSKTSKKFNLIIKILALLYCLLLFYIYGFLIFFFFQS